MPNRLDDISRVIGNIEAEFAGSQPQSLRSVILLLSSMERTVSGSNASALSVGIGHDDAVLLRCFKGCDIAQVTDALGLDMADLFPRADRPGGGRPPMRRRGMLSARQAIDLLEVEYMLVWTAAFNLANGHALTPDDLGRLTIAAGLLQAAIDEVRA